MKVNGPIIKCILEEFIIGKMEENMKVNIRMIKKKVMESTFGPMVEDTKVIGQMENKMEKEFIIYLKEIIILDIGKTEKD